MKGITAGKLIMVQLDDVAKELHRKRSTSAAVAQMVLACVDRILTYDDFSDLPRAGVSIALSRLAKQGILTRVSRGVYYRPQKTVIGQTKVGHGRVEQLLLKGARPTGLSAAVLLGFSSKVPSRNTYAIPQRDPSTRLKSAKMIRQRPYHDLSADEGAIIEFIRDRGAWSDLDADKTTTKLFKLCHVKGRFERLANASLTEVPRVRAILGAIGDQINASPETMDTLLASINPTSKFDFGMFRCLPTAKKWKCKGTQNVTIDYERGTTKDSPDA